jgi:hypothetical protein
VGTISEQDLTRKGIPVPPKPSRVQRISDRLEQASDYFGGSIAQIGVAILFSILSVHIEYAVGAFILLNSHKLVQVLRIIKSTPKSNPNGARDLLGR